MTERFSLLIKLFSSKSANAVAVLSGIVAIPLITWDLTGSLLVTTVTGLGTALVVGLPALSFAVRANFQKRHGIPAYSKRYLVPKKFERIRIEDDYETTVATEKHLIFIEPPQPEDMIDIIEVEPGNSIEQSVYKSSNSSISQTVKREESTIAIYWTPEKEIELFAPHIHNYQYKVPSESAYGPEWFWQGYHCDAHTGFCRWRFECPEEVSEVIAFTMPSAFSQISNQRLGRYHRRGRRNCVQPTISDDRREIIWHIAQPHLHTTYVLIAIFKDGKESFMRDCLVRGNYLQRLLFWR